jgi:hypothetical protein
VSFVEKQCNDQGHTRKSWIEEYYVHVVILTKCKVLLFPDEHFYKLFMAVFLTHIEMSLHLTKSVEPSKL